MSLHISFEDFEKMADKECLKRTGHSSKDFPSVWVDDFWPDPSLTEVDLHTAKEAVEAYIESVIGTL
jgi:hypothetical protein